MDRPTGRASGSGPLVVPLRPAAAGAAHSVAAGPGPIPCKFQLDRPTGRASGSGPLVVPLRPAAAGAAHSVAAGLGQKPCKFQLDRPTDSGMVVEKPGAECGRNLRLSKNRRKNLVKVV